MGVSAYLSDFIDRYRNNRIRRIAKGVVVLLVVISLFFVEFVPSLPSTNANILFLVVVAVVSLEVIESVVFDIESKLERDNEFELMETPREAYRRFASYLPSEQISQKNLYVINYTGRDGTTRELITTAVEEEYEIYLLLKYPSTLDDSSGINNPEINNRVMKFVE